MVLAGKWTEFEGMGVAKLLNGKLRPSCLRQQVACSGVVDDCILRGQMNADWSGELTNLVADDSVEGQSTEKKSRSHLMEGQWIASDPVLPLWHTGKQGWITKRD